MKTYYVTYTIPVAVTVKVEADNAGDAKDMTVNDAYLTGFGGASKMCGTTDEGITIEPNNDLCEFVEVKEAKK
jgi:hypothetical protein